ncbi:MAG: NifU family protein [Candidatus Limnocylindrales bacterium]
MTRAIDKVRPYLGSHGGGVELVGIDGDVVRLRMEGSCSSCPSSAVTLNFALERAILEAAPEISRIEAEEAPPPTAPLIQLQPRGGGGTPDAHAGHAHAARPPAMGRSEWVAVDAPLSLGAGDLAALDLAGLSVLLCQAGGEFYAYANQCPSCRSALDAGSLEAAVLTCRTCGDRYDVRLAGRSIGDAKGHLEPLPLLADGSTLRIAVPAVA